MKIYILLLSSLLLANLSLNAKIGNISEILQESSTSNPSYINKINNELLNKLDVFAHNKNILNSSSEKVAWLLTMRSMLSSVHRGARAIALRTRNAQDNLQEMMLHVAALSTVSADVLAHNVIKSIAQESEITVSLNAAYEEILYFNGRAKAEKITQKALVDINLISDKAIVAFRIAEWALLNIILEDLDYFVEQIYNRTLDYVRKNRLSTGFEVLVPELITNAEFNTQKQEILDILYPWFSSYNNQYK